MASERQESAFFRKSGPIPFGTPVEEHDAFTKIDPSQGYQGTDFDASSKSEEQEKEEYAQQVTMEEVKV